MYIRKYQYDCAEEQAEFCTYARSLIPLEIKNIWRERFFKDSFITIYDPWNDKYQLSIYEKFHFKYKEAVFVEDKDVWTFFIHDKNSIKSVSSDIYLRYLKLKAFI